MSPIPSQTTFPSTSYPSATTTVAPAGVFPGAPFQAWSAAILIMAAIFILSIICSAIVLRNRALMNERLRRHCRPHAGSAPSASFAQNVEKPRGSRWGHWRSTIFQSTRHTNTSRASSWLCNPTSGHSIRTRGRLSAGRPNSTPSARGSVFTRTRAFIAQMGARSRSLQRQSPYSMRLSGSMAPESASSSASTLVEKMGEIAVPKPVHTLARSQAEAVLPTTAQQLLDDDIRGVGLKA